MYAGQVPKPGAQQGGRAGSGFQGAQFGGEGLAGQALAAQFLRGLGEGVVRQLFAVQQFHA